MIGPEERVDKKDTDAIIQRLEDSLKDTVVLKKDVKTGHISDLFDRHILAQLESVFSNSTSGYHSLTAREFRDLISAYIPLSLVENVYRAIDVNDLGHIKYSDFTNYLIASEAGSSFSARTFISKLSYTFAQDDDSSIVHRDMIDCLVYSRRPCPMFITGGRDGQLSIWDPDTLDIITNIDHRDKNSIYKEELENAMDTMVRAQSKKKTQNANKPPTKMAITAMLSLLNWGLLCVGSADCSVTVYELANQEVCGRITDIQHIPTAIECFQRSHPIMIEAMDGTMHQQGEEISSTLAIGDSSGLVHLVKLHPEFGGSAEVGSKKKNQLLFAESIKNITRVQVHKDWITDMHYISEVNSLLTSSVDCTIAFTDTSRREISKVFKGHEGTSTIGIKSFDWSSFGKYVISGAERVLLLWDPYTLEVMGKIDNLRSPVIKVEVSDAYQKIFACLINKNILVCHNITLELLQVISDTTLYKPMDTMASMKFVAEKSMLFTAGNRVTAWTLERAAESASDNEEEDIVTVLYNTLFNQVIMVKSLGTMKIYQTETGEIARQFNILPVDARSNRTIPPIKDPNTGLFKPMLLSASLDKNYSRLIVFNADNSIQFWNIHDGTNLLSFHPQLYASSLSHIYSSQPKFVTQMTHDVLLHKQEDDPRKQVPPQKVLMAGTDLGHVCVFQEMQGVLEEVPMAFLRLTDGATAAIAETGHTLAGTDKAGHRSMTSLNTESTESLEGHSLHGRSHSHTHSQSQSQSRLFGGPSAPSGPAPSHRTKRGMVGTHSQSHSQTSIVSGGQSPPRHRKPPLGVEMGEHSPGKHGSALSLGTASTLSGLENVLWMKLLPAPPGANTPQWLYVGYLSGRVVVWNTETNLKVRDMSTAKLGVSLYAMRLKGAAAAALANLESRLQAEKVAKEKAEAEAMLKKKHEHSVALADIVKAATHRIEEDKEKERERLQKEKEAAEAAAVAEEEEKRIMAQRKATAANRTTTVGGSSRQTMAKAQQHRVTKAMAPKQSLLIALPSRASMAGPESNDIDGESGVDDQTRAAKLKALRAAIMAQSGGARPQGGAGSSSSGSDTTALGNVVPLLEEDEEDHEEGRDYFEGDLPQRPQSKASNGRPSSQQHRQSLAAEHHERLKQTTLLLPHRASQSLPSTGLQHRNTAIDPNELMDAQVHYGASSISTSPRGSPSFHVDSAALTLKKHSTYFLFPSLQDEQELDGHRKLSIALGRVPAPPLRPVDAVPTSAQKTPPVSLSSSTGEKEKVRKSLARRWSTQLHNPLIAGTPVSALTLAAQLGGPAPGAVGVAALGGLAGYGAIAEDSAELGSSISTLSLPHSATEGRGAAASIVGERDKDNDEREPEKTAASLPVRKSIRYSFLSGPSNAAPTDKAIAQPQPPSQSQSLVSSSQVSSSLSPSRLHSDASQQPDGGTQGSTTSNKTVVDCLIVLSHSKVLIGGCSDRMLRVWDIESCEVLCSSPYVPASASVEHGDALSSPVKRALANALPDEVLRRLCVSDSEDVIAGAYDNGTVRVWGVHSYSISTLRNLLTKHLMNAQLHAQGGANGGTGTGGMFGRKKTLAVGGVGTSGMGDFGANMTLAISPLTLISEWSAHVCPILALDYVWFDYEVPASPSHNQSESPSPDKTSAKESSSPRQSQPQQGRAKRVRHGDMGNDVLEGYILTAGLDQKVYLWNLAGKCVGEFGSFGWDINDERTWLIHPHANSSAFVKAMSRQITIKENGKTKKKGPKVAFDADAPEPELNMLGTTAKLTPNQLLNQVRASPSTQFLQHFWQHKKVANSKDMNRYVEELTKKIVNRPPVYQEVDNQLHGVMKKHPVMDVKPPPKKTH